MNNQPKHDFARLYRRNEHQILILKDFNDDKEAYEVKICTQHDSIDICFRLIFKSEKDRNKAFDAIDEEQAGKHFEDLLKKFDIVLKD